ncbi:MAG TPA: DUF192 domain-containing protein [Telluria sp.]|jgi:outer membrane protein OmpA-like peptidoglycan-associated protein/uncharacterized membrane protein (UPF0127 family)
MTYDSRAPGAPRSTTAATLHSGAGRHALSLNVAASFLQRFRGLMLAPPLAPDAGLLLPGCPSVHTMFMRYPIDVLYLDRDGRVLKCVPALKPWRASISNAGRDASGQRHQRAAHTLELAAGAIGRFGLAAGDRLEHPLFLRSGKPAPIGGLKMRQGGVALIEMAVVGPILTVLGLALVQYGMMFFAKNQMNHASFMAARSGSVHNASVQSVTDAYAIALVPMYGGGETAAEIAKSLADAKLDLALNSKIEILNPTAESFADFGEAALQTKYNTNGKRVIPNGNLAFKPQTVGATSGQTLQDANLLKLRITHGYKPVVPIVASIYKSYLKYFDPKDNAYQTLLIENGRIPVVNYVTVQMQSDAIEPSNPISSPGAGNNGNPTDPGDPPGNPNPGPPPDCTLGGCTTPPPATGGTCPVPVQTTLSSDTLFAFDSATLGIAGQLALDKLIARVNDLKIEVDILKVTGHTDPLGSEAHNLDLSKRRAQAVLDYLNQKGLRANNVEVNGVGSTELVKPLAQCQNMNDADTKACLAPNRRVVVDIIPK